MRLHEYIRAMKPEQQKHFELWRKQNSQKIYQIRKHYDPKSKLEQAEFESKLVLLHQKHTTRINTI